MASRNTFNCLPTMIGSMPQTDAVAACAMVAKYLPGLPAWPQLPGLSPKENMYVQCSEGFPGIAIEGAKLYVDRDDKFDARLEILFNTDVAIDNNVFGISPEYAAGLYELRSMKDIHPTAVKGQLTGPISWGLMATDRDQRGILYDELLAETVAKFLKLKAAWLERFMKPLSRHTVIFIDEPYLTSLGTAFVAIPSKQVSALIEEVLGGISGMKGVHCCGTTDWQLLLKSSTDILSFDAYNYADSLACYRGEVEAFLERGGAVAWGIVTNDEELLAKETVSSLFDRLGEAIAPYTGSGLTTRQIFSQSMLTPSCGLASLPIDAAEKALQLLAELSARVRGKYIG